MKITHKYRYPVDWVGDSHNGHYTNYRDVEVDGTVAGFVSKDGITHAVYVNDEDGTFHEAPLDEIILKRD